jgi:hypothetical protein
MAATGTVSIIAELLGLGKEARFLDRFSLTNAPTKTTYNYRQQAVADTAEALDLGGVSTVDLVIIKAITNDMTIDASFDTTYHAELNLPEGEISVFKPSGTIYIKNEDAAEQATYEYLVIGR